MCKKLWTVVVMSKSEEVCGLFYSAVAPSVNDKITIESEENGQRIKTHGTVTEVLD